eukprot:2558650-Rhodomonas_salina.3
MPGTDNRGDVAMPDTGNRGTDSTRDHTRRTCLVVARQPMLAVMPARLRDLLVLPHLLAHLRHRDLQLDLPAVLFQVLCRAPRRRSVSVVKAKKNGKCMRIQAFSIAPCQYRIARRLRGKVVPVYPTECRTCLGSRLVAGDAARQYRTSHSATGHRIAKA